MLSGDWYSLRICIDAHIDRGLIVPTPARDYVRYLSASRLGLNVEIGHIDSVVTGLPEYLVGFRLRGDALRGVPRNPVAVQRVIARAAVEDVFARTPF